MKTEDAFAVIPFLAIIGGAIAHFGFGVSLGTAVVWSAVIGFSPHIALAGCLVVIWLFYGGFNNDRPSCACGKCSSNDYLFDDGLTRARNGDAVDHSEYEWCYRCPSCHTLWVARSDTFYRIDGERLVPFRKRNRWGRWRPVS